MTKIELALHEALKIAGDDSHGYSQDKRYGPDYDCSSLIAKVLNEQGYQVSKYSYTGNLYRQLIDCGFTLCTAPWKPGDIHLTPGHHVCMSVNNEKIVHARINELGKTTGGKPGDQTGNEITVSDYYEPSYGWKYHLRAPVEKVFAWGEDYEEKAWAVAWDTSAGKYGNYPERQTIVKELGFDYQDIQARVNAICIARQVIRGKFGNGDERKTRLENMGYNYTYVQRAVNEILENTKEG